MKQTATDSNYQELFKLCLEHSDNLLLILSNDFSVKYINPSALAILGWQKKHVIENNIFDIFKSNTTEPFIDKALGSDHTTTFLPYGNRILKVNWKLIHLVASDSQNQIYFIVGKDATELTKKELEHLQLENMVKYAPGFFYWKDVNGVYQGCNDEFARLAGLESRDLVIGKTDFDLIWGQMAEDYVEVDKKVIATGKAILNHEETINVSNNRTIIAITNKVPLLDHNNRVVGVLGITTDITQQKETEHDLSIAKERAEAANKAKSAFIANMSHDVRGPIASTIGLSKLLEAENDIDQTRQYAHIIHETNEKLLVLLDDILDMVAAEDIDEDQLKMETFNLKICLEDLRKLLLGHATIKHIDVQVNIDPSLPPYVISDKSKLFRILLNLVNNAIKFTDKGSVQIDVELLQLEKESIRLLFRVTDTGIGIPEDKLNQIFDRFFRVTPSYTNKYSGYGLGLFLVKKFVDLLKGNINVTSKLGNGSQFEITLPVGISNEKNIQSDGSLDASIVTKELSIKSPKEMKSLTAIEQKNYSSPGQYRALVVEDDSVARHIVTMSMRKLGFEVIGTDSAEAGFNYLMNEPYDLILTDIGLPGLDGHQLATLIRSWERILKRNPLPIVGLSAHGSTQQEQALTAGMNLLLSKPIDDKKLKVIMDKFFSAQPSEGSEEYQSTISAGDLGHDLPNTENELFQLDKFKVFDEENGTQSASSLELLKELLIILLSRTLSAETDKLEIAYANQDWSSIQAIAHKLKGGALYCGTIRLRYACQFVEHYLLAGHSKLQEQLYQQLLTVIQDTKEAVQKWLSSHT